MNKIRKGDEVVVLAGKDKGKSGSVARCLGEYVEVEGVNVVKRHVKPNPMKGAVGGVVDKVMPLHISNVAVVDPQTGKAGKIGIREVDGKKVRVFKSSGAVVGVQ